jgi:hypothetical protein
LLLLATLAAAISMPTVSARDITPQRAQAVDTARDISSGAALVRSYDDLMSSVVGEDRGASARVT